MGTTAIPLCKGFDLLLPLLLSSFRLRLLSTLDELDSDKVFNFGNGLSQSCSSSMIISCSIFLNLSSPEGGVVPFTEFSKIFFLDPEYFFESN